MEAALVSVSMGVMKSVLSKLTKLLDEEYVKIKGMRKQIKFLRDELSAMSAALQIVADSEQLNPLMRQWRDKVRELAYDIEDCIDAFTAHFDHDRTTSFKGFFGKLKKLKARHEIANEIQELKTRAIEASERHKRYNFVEIVSNSRAFSIDPRLPAFYEEVDRLVGIDRPKEHIIEWLNKEKGNQNLKVLSIVGCGGLGKTTLAIQAYCQLKDQFQYTNFVSVSRNPCIKMILRHVLNEVGISNEIVYDERQLIDRIRDFLKDKRYFLVIDDVWDSEAWKAIRLALFDNRCGSRIIMTTRNVAVASCCSRDDGYVYQMAPLSFDDSKRLFCQRAFSSGELFYPHVKTVCDGIVRKCGGVPLAIITISSLLADKISKDEWDRVLTAIGHTLAKDPDAGSMTKILSLSYFDLPQHLRSCFLYLSVFPEDYNINKQRLKNRWIAEGFVEEEQSRSAYEIGEIHFNELINRSLIQPYKLKYGQAWACRVHDIILDFIKCKAAEENFVASMDTVEHGLISDCRVRRLCIDNRNEEKANTSAGLIPSHVRSLTIFGHFAQTSLSAFTALRVLDLEDCINFQDHDLTNIEKVYNLKYLCLRSYTITEIPRKIGFLQFLETLDIRATKIVELPLTITKLQRLARLYIDPCTRFPNGTIGQMQSLEELQEFGVYSYELGKPLQEFSQLTKLRTLVVSWNFDWPDDSEGGSLAKNLQGYVGTLVSSCNLHHLCVLENNRDIPMRHALSLDSWSPAASCSLRKLHITYCLIYKVPYWMCSLENLKELKLYISCMRPEDFEILGEIPSLIFLELTAWYGTNGRIFIDGNNRFRSLKYFSLYMLYCGTALEFEAGSMPKLEHLQIRIPVHKIECLNGSFDLGIQHLSTLIKVEVAIVGDFRYYSNHNMSTDMENGIIKCVEGSIKAAVEALPSSPILKFRTHYYDSCHFEEFVEFPMRSLKIAKEVQTEQELESLEKTPKSVTDEVARWERANDELLQPGLGQSTRNAGTALPHLH